MGRREAWSADRSADSKTKSTRWEFSKRGYSNQKIGIDNLAATNDEIGTGKHNVKFPTSEKQTIDEV